MWDRLRRNQYPTPNALNDLADFAEQRVVPGDGVTITQALGGLIVAVDSLDEATTIDQLTEDAESLDLLTAGPGPTYYLTSDKPADISAIPGLPDLPDGYQITVRNNNDPYATPSPAPWAITFVHNPDVPGGLNLPGGLDVALAPGMEFVLRWDADEQVWQFAIGANGGGGPAPPALAAEPMCVEGAGAITLSWAASAGPPAAAAYQVYVATTSDMADAFLAAVVPADYPYGLSATITGLNSGTTYYSSVAAVGASGGVSAMSDVHACTPTAGHVVGSGLPSFAPSFSGEGVGVVPVFGDGSPSFAPAFSGGGTGATPTRGSGSPSFAPTFAGGGTGAVSGGSPPCSTGNTYQADVSGVTGGSPFDDANGVYPMANIGGQLWNGTNGVWEANMDLSSGPYQLVFTDGGSESATYEAAAFDCATGATFGLVSSTGGSWPAMVDVTLF